MSSPLSMTVSGSDADPPEQHDTRAVPPPETESAPAIRAESPAPAKTGLGAKSVIWSKIVENLVPAILCGLVVGMFGFVLSSTNDKIDKLEIRTNDKIDKLEIRMNDKIDDLDAKVDDLDVKVDEINLKLTALIAALNKTDDVHAAVSGVVTPADP